MSDEDIDLDRVVVDPEYRRKVIAFLNGSRAEHVSRGAGDERAMKAQRQGLTVD
jgi:hypothetical protein